MDKDKPPPFDMRPKKPRGPGKRFPKGVSGIPDKRFKPGVAANPGGRPRQFIALREVCRNVTPELIDLALEMARNKKTPSNSRVRAIELLLNYGHGRPAQALAIGVGSFDAQTPGDEMATNGLTALLMSARAESGKDPITGGKPLLLPPPIEGEGADEYRERLDAVVKAAPAVTSSVPKPAPLKSIELSIEEPEAAPANPAPIIEEPVETKVAAPEPAMVEKAPPPPPPLPKAPPRGAPAAFAAHYEEKAADRAAQRQADLPGGQVPAQDFFRPDSTAESPQGPLEVVTLTRSEYGGVRRV